MEPMRPDQIREEMDKQRRKDIQSYIFVALMLVVFPLLFIVSLFVTIAN